jgi:glutamyl-tRNA synthetase
MSITRFAPSPTGLFHIGGVRTAYLNYLEARSTSGLFILRIDDTDLERNKTEYTQVILDSMEWLGLDYDEIHFQSNRTEKYKEVAHWLLEQKKAFEADNGAIILHDFLSAPEHFWDTIAGNVAITQTNREQITNKIVLLRGGDKLGQPTYQFASVVDDYELGIEHIIRGLDHLSNTPKQLAIWQNLEFNKLELPPNGRFSKS